MDESKLDENRIGRKKFDENRLDKNRLDENWAHENKYIYVSKILNFVFFLEFSQKCVYFFIFIL